MTSIPALPLAIPSPDLILNLFASVGQLLGLAAVLLGGAAWNRRGAGTRRAGASRTVVWTLGLLWMGTSGAFLLYHMRTVDAHEGRLRASLLRSSREEGVRVGDSSLKTLSFSGQLEHPQGLATEELASWLAQGAAVNLIDVRETEEVEGGAIPGSWHRRYPELEANREGLELEGAQTVLLCYSGNRSSELAELFLADGVECRFLVGGYEKWIAEGRPLDLARGRSRAQLRELPSFPGDDVLLDTEAVRAQLARGAAIFVDVRYPEDFARDALPGAINLPLRKLRDAELAAAIAALPPGPIIVPCYDKRSSFYASILGLKATRAGREFLGRYTLPYEYSPPGKQRAHVAAWEAARGQTSLLAMLTGRLATLVSRSQTLLGSLTAAIFALVLLSRLCLLPLSWKADRDQVLGERLKLESRELARRFAHDPVLALRERMARQRAAGLTPLRNLLGTSLQLVLLLALFGAIARVARGSGEHWLWLELGAADPARVTPVLVGLLMAGLVLAGRLRTAGKLRWTLAVAAGLVLVGLSWKLLAAQNLYLVGSLGWISVQTALARRSVALPGARAREEERRPRSATVSLEACAYTIGVGKKAQRLGALVRAGLPVPAAFAIPQETIDRGQAGGLSAQDEAAVRRAFQRLRAASVAVRSSGSNEDGADKSYAGVFDSVLEVSAERLMPAVREVVASMTSERAQVYGESEESGGVLVQTMVAAEYAGVLFTEHPSNAGAMMIELVEGLGEDLVGGRATPQGYAFGRVTGAALQPTEPPIDLAPLLELGRRVERLFGRAQDIEWAYAEGRYLLLQARDVTACASRRKDTVGLREAERARLVELARRSGVAADEPFLAQTELTELLPEPTPMSLALMHEMWAPGGSVDLACRSFGIPYEALEEAPSLVQGAFGTLWVDRAEERRRRGDLSALAAFRLARSAEALALEFHERVRPRIEARVRLYEWCELESRSGPELLELFEELRVRFLTETYVEAERINIAADIYLSDARKRLEREGLDPADSLAHLPPTVVGRSFELLRGLRHGSARVEDYLEHFGHRAPHDFELAEARWREVPERVLELARNAADLAPTQHADPDSSLPHGRLAALEVCRAREFQALKEEAKHVALREYAVLRRILLAIGERSGLGQDVFWLRPAELREIRFDRAGAALPLELDQRVSRRRQRALAFRGLGLPSRLSARELERLDLSGSGPALRSEPGAEGIHGTHVAGSHEVVGVVRVLQRAEDLASFRAGEVLVTRFTDPTWAAIFPLAAGLVTEVGGWLSHAAIQAREYGIACIAGAEGALSTLATGDLVRLGLDGSVTRLASRRAHARVGHEARVELALDERRYSASLHDASAGGAALLLDQAEVAAELEIGDELDLFGLEAHVIEVRVARKATDGFLAVEFLPEPCIEVLREQRAEVPRDDATALEQELPQGLRKVQ